MCHSIPIENQWSKELNLLIQMLHLIISPVFYPLMLKYVIESGSVFRLNMTQNYSHLYPWFPEFYSEVMATNQIHGTLDVCNLFYFTKVLQMLLHLQEDIK